MLQLALLWVMTGAFPRDWADGGRKQLWLLIIAYSRFHVI